MSDVVYRLKSIPRHAGAVAERSAVLWPISGMTPNEGNKIAEAVAKATTMWRLRCVKLREAGEPMLRGLKFQCARNCPPAGVDMEPVGSNAKLWTCRLRTICPWCWARLTVKRAFDEVTETLERLGETYDRAAPESGRYKLILTTANGLRDDSVDQPRALLYEVGSTMSDSKRAFAPVSKDHLMIGVVSPGKVGWVHSTRALVLVPKGHPTKPGIREYAPLTKRNIARGVARFARYPKGLLAEDLDRTMRLLGVRGRHRLLRFSGVFSGQPGRKLDDDAPGRYLDL